MHYVHLNTFNFNYGGEQTQAKCVIRANGPHTGDSYFYMKSDDEAYITIILEELLVLVYKSNIANNTNVNHPQVIRGLHCSIRCDNLTIRT